MPYYVEKSSIMDLYDETPLRKECKCLERKESQTDFEGFWRGWNLEILHWIDGVNDDPSINEDNCNKMFDEWEYL